MLPRRQAIATLLAPAIARAPSARAQASWPSQPIKLVVPYPPGGLTDVLGRLAGQRLHEAFGQPVVVENKPGAATQLGASLVAKQPADGHALLLATVSTLCITPALYAKPLIVHTDFAGAAMLGNVTLILICRPDLPVKDPKELVALLQAKPGGYTYGSPGVGTMHHLLVEVMRSRLPFQAVHVPYLGSIKAAADLMEGRFDFMFCDAPVAAAHIASGKLKALAVTGTKPDSTLPDVPPITQYFPGLDLQPWMSLAAPAGTPAAVLERINAAINQSLVEASFVERLRQIGVQPTPLTVAALDDFIRRDSGRWAEVVKASGAKAE